MRFYRHDAKEFLTFCGKGITEITIFDVQDYEDMLNEHISVETGNKLSDATKARKINAVKSLLTFCSRIGYVQVNVGTAHKAPTVQSKVSHRILSEVEVMRLIEAVKDNPRNHAIMRLLYNAGLRVSEVCGITWNDCIDRGELGAQITVIGKGNKQREVLVSLSVWNEMKSLRVPVDQGYVFQSRKGHGKLTGVQVERVVTQAAKIAGIDGNVSPHWLRHSHASHSLDNGANINLVKETLGHADIRTTGMYLHARPNTSSSQFVKDL
jgi:site-specific recombinase XerD